ncbi:DUF6573 family protein [Streptomyces anulatus]|uniref:DUF6573 family protein n=1 Tax=Streptomyces anulatus TaxID=1892 RepID=UPI001D190DB5|nr:DUF6573 family protein [Streptomyces anulatus]
MTSSESLGRIDADLSVSRDAMRCSPTRAQAITDGDLVAVEPGIAREAGWQAPLAITRAAWDDCVSWNDEDSTKQMPLDETGRLWDVLYMAMAHVRGQGFSTSFHFELYRVPRDGRSVTPELVRLHCGIGPSDEGDPVITIRQPDEV